MGQNALHVITLLAIAQIGAVSLPLHTAVPAERRLLAAKRFGAATIVSGRDDMALTGLAFISLANVSFDGSSIPPDSEIHAVDADTLFRIALSSGTSADPKGMMFTHRLWISRTNRPEHDFSLHSRTLPMDLNFSILLVKLYLNLEVNWLLCMIVNYNFLHTKSLLMVILKVEIIN